MTTIYFVRHAEPNYKNHDDNTRELTEKGMLDRKRVTNYLNDKNIDIILSSPYKRTIDTLKDFGEKHNLPIEIINDFRERKIDSVWIEDFNAFCKQQWDDFSYKLSDGETLGEVQNRNIVALMGVVRQYKDKNIVIGSHGTALSTIINYFDKSFGYLQFESIKLLMPWIVKMTFNDENLQNIEMIDVFSKLS